ncbi:MAG: hypothetical protein ACTS47_02770 [Candidatus Hodgkinia cicadicola]
MRGRSNSFVMLRRPIARSSGALPNKSLFINFFERKANGAILTIIPFRWRPKHRNQRTV